MATRNEHRKRSHVSYHSNEQNKRYFFNGCSAFTYAKSKAKEEKKKHG